MANALARAAELGKDGIDPEGDYEVDEKRSAPSPMKASPRLSRCSGCGSVQPSGSWAHYITNALKAKELFVKDVNYIVRDGER